jgi:hypothetical protein
MQSKYNKEVLLAHATEPTLEDVTSLLSASAADPGIKQEDDRILSITLVAVRLHYVSTLATAQMRNKRGN